MCSSAQFSIGSSTLLNSIVEFCVAETSKPKTTTANLETLEMTLKTVSNCCCCVEGRLLIAKVSFFLFSNVRISNMKICSKLSNFYHENYSNRHECFIH